MGHVRRHGEILLRFAITFFIVCSRVTRSMHLCFLLWFGVIDRAVLGFCHASSAQVNLGHYSEREQLFFLVFSVAWRPETGAGLGAKLLARPGPAQVGARISQPITCNIQLATSCPRTQTRQSVLRGHASACLHDEAIIHCSVTHTVSHLIIA